MVFSRDRIQAALIEGLVITAAAGLIRGGNIASIFSTEALMIGILSAVAILLVSSFAPSIMPGFQFGLGLRAAGIST